MLFQIKNFSINSEMEEQKQAKPDLETQAPIEVIQEAPKVEKVVVEEQKVVLEKPVEIELKEPHI